MFKYSIKIQKVSGILTESVLPSKNLTIKSNTKKTDKQVFAEASKYLNEKYGLELESADIIFEGFFSKVKGMFGKKSNQPATQQQQQQIPFPKGRFLDGSSAVCDSKKLALYWRKHNNPTAQKLTNTLLQIFSKVCSVLPTFAQKVQQEVSNGGSHINYVITDTSMIDGSANMETLYKKFYSTKEKLIQALSVPNRQVRGESYNGNNTKSSDKFEVWASSVIKGLNSKGVDVSRLQKTFDQITNMIEVCSGVINTIEIYGEDPQNRNNEYLQQALYM